MTKKKEEEMEEPEIPAYGQGLTCDNCRETEYVEIPKGLSVDDYTAAHLCPNCGCATMRRSPEGPRKRDIMF